MLSKLAVRRLTKLADYMDGLPSEAKKHFFMGSWFGHRGVGHAHGSKSGPLVPKDLVYCGTTACAAGWACTIPSFRRAGLVLIKEPGHVHGGHIEFDGTENEALQVFFEINDDMVKELFAGDVKTKTPKQWATRCRKFLRENS